MTSAQAAAYIMAMTISAQCELQAMLACNRAYYDNNPGGLHPPYSADDIRGIPETFGIHHNQVLTTFHGAYNG